VLQGRRAILQQLIIKSAILLRFKSEPQGAADSLRLQCAVALIWGQAARSTVAVGPGTASGTRTGSTGSEPERAANSRTGDDSEPDSRTSESLAV
jgi:hypothetical protein